MQPIVRGGLAGAGTPPPDTLLVLGDQLVTLVVVITGNEVVFQESTLKKIMQESSQEMFCGEMDM